MAQLPADIWLEICKTLNWLELKSLRATSRMHAAVATPSLFKTVVLRPNSQSLKHAFCIANSPSLYCLVDKLLLLPETVFGSCEDIATHMNVFNIKERKYKGYAVVDFFLFCQQRPRLTRWEQKYHKINEPLELTRLARELPNLSQIQRDGRPSFHPWTCESAFARTYGLSMAMAANEFSFSAVLSATGAQDIDSLSCQNLPWSQLEQGWISGQETFKPLRNIKHLHLTLDEPSLCEVISDLRLTAFTKLLYQLYKIENFVLDLGASLYSHGHVCRPLWRTLFELKLPLLRYLKVTDVVCAENTLLRFISRHGASLKHLSFDGLTIHPDEDGDSNDNEGDEGEEGQKQYAGYSTVTSSAIRVLWVIPYVCSLESFSLERNVRCCGEEDWILDDSGNHSERTTHLRSLQDYVCGAGPFPFPQLLRPLSFADALRTLEVPLIDDEGVSDALQQSFQSTTRFEREVLLSTCSDPSWRWNHPTVDCRVSTPSDADYHDDFDYD